MWGLWFHLCVLDNSGHGAIKVEDFAEHVVLLKAEENSKITEEFETIAVDVPFTHHAAQFSRNKPKNRYKNIIPCKLPLL